MVLSRVLLPVNVKDLAPVPLKAIVPVFVKLKAPVPEESKMFVPLSSVNMRSVLPVAPVYCSVALLNLQQPQRPRLLAAFEEAPMLRVPPPFARLETESRPAPIVVTPV